MIYYNLKFQKKEEKKMDEFISLVGNVGFPIAVATYLLVRIEGKLTILTQSINELSKSITMLK